MNHLTLQHSGAWSFGDSQRAKLRASAEEFPGPGAYDAKFSKSCSGWTQPKNPRNSTFIRDGLGAAVGTYDPNSSSVYPHSTKYSMGGQTRSKTIHSLTRQTNHTPNTILTKPHSPFFSFGYVPEPLNNFKTPAPWQYGSEKSKSQFNRSQNHFTRGMRQLQKKPAPGVGDYDVQQNQQPAPSYTIGVPRQSIYKNQSPDKFYTIGGEMKNFQKGKSLGVRCQKSTILIPNDNPAPGAYEPNMIDSKKNIINLTASRTSIIPEQAKHVPGPGAYQNISREDISERSSKGIKFAQSKRSDNINTLNPGFVGRYEAPSSLKSVLGKISQKIRKSVAEETPGPSSYTPQHLLAKARRSLTMYSNRVDFSKSDTKHIGPGQYDSSKGIKPQFGTMSRSKRDTACSKNPGPGDYKIPTTIGRIPNYYKSLNKKIGEDGSTKTIVYSPEKTREIRMKTTTNTFNNKKEDEK